MDAALDELEPIPIKVPENPQPVTSAEQPVKVSNSNQNLSILEPENAEKIIDEIMLKKTKPSQPVNLFQRKDDFQSFGVQMPSNEFLKKNHYKMALHEYKTHFSQYLSLHEAQLTKEHIDSLDEAGLESLYQEVTLAVGCRHSANFIPKAIQFSSYIPELLGPAIGINLQGFSKYVTASKMMEEEVKEISILYNQHLYIHPIARLGANYMALMLEVHLKNTAEANMMKEMMEKVSDNVRNEFKDL